MYCMNCGKEIDEKAVFCKNCGAKVKQPVTGNTYPGNTQPTAGNTYSGNTQQMAGNIYQGNGNQVGNYGVPAPVTGEDNKQKETKKRKEKKQKVRKKKDPKKTLLISLILFAVVVIGGAALGTFLYVRKKQQATISYKLNAMREYYDKFCDENGGMDMEDGEWQDSVLYDADCTVKLLFDDNKPVMVITDLVRMEADNEKLIYNFYLYECIDGKVTETSRIKNAVCQRSESVPVFVYKGKIYIIADQNYCIEDGKTTVVRKLPQDFLKDESSYGSILFPSEYTDESDSDSTYTRSIGSIRGDIADDWFEYAGEHFDGKSEFELNHMFAEYLIEHGYEKKIKVFFEQDGIWYMNLLRDPDTEERDRTYEESDLQDGSAEETEETDVQTADMDFFDDDEKTAIIYDIDGVSYSSKDEAEKAVDPQYNGKDFAHLNDCEQAVITDLDNWKGQIRRDESSDSGSNEQNLKKQLTNDVVTVYQLEDTDVENVAIPDSVQGYPVVGVKIEKTADSHMKKLQIPASVTYISLPEYGKDEVILFCDKDSYTQEYAEKTGHRYVIGDIVNNENDTPIVPEEAAIDEKIIPMYEEHIQNYFESYGGMFNELGYLYKDINGDGIPELFVEFRNHADWLDDVLLFVDQNQQVQEITGNDLYYNANNGDVLSKEYEYPSYKQTVTKSLYSYDKDKGKYKELKAWKKTAYWWYSSYESFVNENFSDGWTQYEFLDLDHDGLMEMLVQEMDDIGYYICSIDPDGRAFNDCHINGDGYCTSDGTIIGLGEVSQDGMNASSKNIYTYDPETRSHEMAHEMNFVLADYDAYAQLIDPSEYYKDSDVMDYYVDGKKYSTYKKAVKKFNSFYSKDDAVKIEPVWYSSLEEAYDNIK